jgi:eukaryotic-like serine/threonine-protein kinase
MNGFRDLSKITSSETIDIESVASPSSELQHANVTSAGTEPRLAGNSAAFATGDLLEQRYRIVRFIAQGGMGEVYEAEDLELKKRVAIKTLRAQIADNPVALAGFKQEIKLAQEITHPNVCRTYDFVRITSGPSGPARNLPSAFLTMEFLPGETLAAALRRKGRFSPEELLPLARSMAEALAAAHRAGIIHQDFKTNNVLLTPSGQRSTVRVVVSDFGLAQSVTNSELQSHGGTPDYMAPEQVLGEPLTKSADVFSFGVVLYELVTGRLPYPATSAREAMDKRVQEAPIPPSRFVTNLPPEWERVILRCLARDTKERFSDVTAAIRELDVARRRRLVRIVTALILFVLMLGGFFLVRHFRKPPVLPRVAVVGPYNDSGDAKLDWIGTEVADSLTSMLDFGPKDLPKGRKLQVVPRDEVVRTVYDLSLAESGDPQKQNLSMLRDALGAPYLILGKYREIGATPERKFHVSLLLQGPDGGQLAALQQDVSDGDLNEFLSTAARRFRAALGQASVYFMPTPGIYPSDPSSRKLYFEAVGQLRALNATAALEALQRAAPLESSALIHSSMADAWTMLRHDEDASREAQKAADLAENSDLPGEYKLSIKAKAYETKKDWESAIRTYDALRVLDSTKMEYALGLAYAQLNGSKANDALRTIDLFSKVNPGFAGDPRLALAKARILDALSQKDKAIVLAQTALLAAKQRKAHLVEANAELELCWLHRSLGHVEEAIQACESAKSTFEAFGDSVSAAVTLNNIANWLSDRGRYREAKSAFDQVVAIDERAHAQKDLAGALYNSAKASLQLENSGDAERLLRRSIEVSRLVGDKEDETCAHIALAEILRDRGDLGGALAEARSANNLAVQISSLSLEAYALSAFGLVQAETGDLSNALDSHLKARSIRQNLKDSEGMAASSSRIGDVYLRMGNPGLAVGEYRNSLEAYSSLQQWKDVAGTELSLADAEIEALNFSSAETYARKSLAILTDPDDGESRRDALSFLIRALIGLGRISEARGLLAEMKSLPASDADVRADSCIAEALLLANSNKVQEAVDLLAAGSENAEQSGRRFTALRLRLAAVEVQKSAATHNSILEQCEILSAQAKRLGFNGIARKASSLARG